jgi:mannose-6-phosphate isomerase-like protein (cupin superfamily)
MSPPAPTARIEKNAAGAEYDFREGCAITEWWNHPADDDVSVARARVAPGDVTRWHRLRNTTERYLVLEGQGLAEVGDLPPTPVGPGDAVVIPPGQRQRIHNTGETDLVFLAVCTPRFHDDHYEDLEPSVAPL